MGGWCMMALFELALVLVLAGIAWSVFVRRRRGGEREAITERRVDAYMQTIRREASNPELAAMTDIELKDLLLSSARNLRVDAERRTYVLFGAGAVALVAAIVVATQEGWQGFGIALLIAAIGIYGLGEFLSRRMREPLREKGIDVERLRVE